jgi:hypothetical protein
MQEKSVTYGGENYALPAPFLIIATQNPIEQAGIAIAFYDQRNGAALRDRSRFAGSVSGLCKAKCTMQHIHLFAIQFEFCYK